MSVDNLITIGVIIYVIYSVKKAFSSAKKDGKENKQKSAGWAGKLGDFVNDIKNEIEKANQMANNEKAPATILTESEITEPEPSLWESLREPEPKTREPYSEKPESTVKKRPEVLEVAEESNRNHLRTDDVLETKTCRKKAAFLQSDLQKAVVWSEILAKPISLRE